MNPGSPEAVLLRAEGFMELGDHVSAWEALEDLPSEAKASYEVLFLRLKIFTAGQSWENLQILASSMLEIMPHSATVLYSLAVAHCQLGDIEQAKSCLKQAVEQSPVMAEVSLLDPLLINLW